MQQPATSPLRIVVLAGEDAVNVIQQKTAVAPLVEIRDRNNLPVAGATVTFTIGGNSAAFAGGAQTLTVVTNAAGRAAAAGLSPVASGAVQINVAAAFQGQSAIAATIAQTNVLTAAEAAGAAASSAGGATGASGGTGASSGAAGGAAGGGGGLSATTIGIVGAAVGGGALAATQALGKEDEDDGLREVAGPFNGQLSMAFQGCTRVQEMSGTLTIEVNSLTGTYQGTVHIQGNSRVLSLTGPQCGGPPSPQVGSTDTFGVSPKPISGTMPSIAFEVSESNTAPGPGGVSGTSTQTYVFSGTLSGDTVTGTLTQSMRVEAPGSGFPAGVGTVTYSVTLHPN